MRRNILKNLMLAFFTALTVVCLFTKSFECVKGIKEGLALCMNAVIPSLFPFMIVSQFTVKSGLADFLGGILGKAVKKIFKLSGVCAAVILLSLTGGYPVGAKMTCDLLKDGKISKNEAQRLNLFCINAGPAFVIGTVGDIFASSRKIGLILFASNVIASLTVGVLSTVLYDKKPLSDIDLSAENMKEPVKAFTQSMSEASKAVFGICSWVIIFNAIISCILSLSNKEYIIVLCSLLEVTSGVKLSCGIFPLPVTAAVLSFGGLSVHCQILSCIQQSGISFKLFYTSRIITAVLSGVICHILLRFFPFEAEVFASASSITASAYSVSLPSAIALVTMCCSLIFELDTGKKV